MKDDANRMYCYVWTVICLTAGFIVFQCCRCAESTGTTREQVVEKIVR